ncbi:MAG: hypothetical protein A4E40_00425 [Methanoregulaceae archaeon PtaU1.Bin059]|nr:MAG: hypothetical protein A4E40_00425 [Methanoregulaceae archaeon PtaU1.Bin059]
MPQRSAPSAMARAMSSPLLIPPVAMIGPPVPATSHRLTAVGIPQSSKRAPRDTSPEPAGAADCSALTPSTAAQDVPPQPPMSIARTPAPQQERAVSADIPLPVSLTITGTLLSLQRAARAS